MSALAPLSLASKKRSAVLLTVARRTLPAGVTGAASARLFYSASLPGLACLPGAEARLTVAGGRKTVSQFSEHKARRLSKRHGGPVVIRIAHRSIRVCVSWLSAIKHEAGARCRTILAQISVNGKLS